MDDKEMKAFELGSLVQSAEERVETTAPDKNSEADKPKPTSPKSYENGSAFLKKMGPEHAMKLVNRMLAGVPYLTVHDPEGYRLALIEVMSDFPIWAGEQAIVKSQEANPDFAPTAARLRLYLSDIVRPYLFAQEWNARSAKQLKEREEVEREVGSKPAPTSNDRQTIGDGGPGTIYSNYDEAFAKHGRPIGVFENAATDGAPRTVPYRGSK